jgi:hypothetical protein
MVYAGIFLGFVSGMFVCWAIACYWLMPMKEALFPTEGD